MTVDLASLLAGLGVKMPPKPKQEASRENFKLAVGVMQEAQKMCLEMNVSLVDILSANSVCLTDLVAATTRPDNADRIIDGLATAMKKDVAKRHSFLAGLGLIQKNAPAAEDPAKPDADGWIKWIGGDCPIKDGVNFEFAFRADDRPVEANCLASDLRWSHRGNGGDIIRYRVLS